MEMPRERWIAGHCPVEVALDVQFAGELFLGG